MHVCLSTYTLTLLFFLSRFDAAPQSSEHQDASCSLCTEHAALDSCADQCINVWGMPFSRAPAMLIEEKCWRICDLPGPPAEFRLFCHFSSINMAPALKKEMSKTHVHKFGDSDTFIAVITASLPCLAGKNLTFSTVCRLLDTKLTEHHRCLRNL